MTVAQRCPVSAASAAAAATTTAAAATTPPLGPCGPRHVMPLSAPAGPGRWRRGRRGGACARRRRQCGWLLASTASTAAAAAGLRRSPSARGGCEGGEWFGVKGM